MNVPVRLRCSILAIVLVGAIPAAAQVPPRDPGAAIGQPTPAGTAVIAGTVMMAGSTQPARKARVSLSAAELRGGRSVTTDDQGRYSFTSLPAGRYSLSANKPGHVSVTYGQRQPGRPGTPIQLSDGQKFQADLQIPKGSVITGTVLDENGEPTPQTQVRVMRVVTRDGRRTLQGSSSGSTDDRGIYRVFNLLPGDYVVCATPRNNNPPRAARMEMVEELLDLRRNLETSVRVNPDQAQMIGERIAAIRGTTPAEEDAAPPGYAPVCYPGTISSSSASPVTLGIAEERPGIDFQLQLAPLARVEGTVVNGTGAQLREINVTLRDAQQSGFSFGNISARADENGRFRLMNVPPGQYRVTARATTTPARGSAPSTAGSGGGRGRGAAQPVPRVEPVTVWASADVAVDGRLVSNVMLSLQQGIAVSGQVSFDGSTPQPDPSRIRVTLAPSEPTPFGGSLTGRVDAGGRFTIPSVPPGRYRLNASGAGTWIAESAVLGGQDALDFPFEIKGNQNVSGALITFTDRRTELTGVVTNERNQPGPEYTLVVFPADSHYWSGTSRRIQSTRPGTDGRYTFRNLPPGEYRIAPLFDLEPGATSDPAFLQQLEATSLRVTLRPGETKTQDMRLGG
jgi:protocatechuate 3,4-dioxygenase beta subunit